MARWLAAAAAVLILNVAFGNKPASAYEITSDSVHRHVAVLASDSLEGRETGEIGEWKASQYIAAVFKAAGLAPHGDSGSYLQAFEFVKRIDFSENNRLTVNGRPLKLYEDFEPMLQSADTSFRFDQIVPVNYGITVEGSSYDDYAGKDVTGKAVLIKRFSPPKDQNPHIDFDAHSSITDKVMTALSHNVSGIFFITPTDHDDTLMSVGFTHVTPKDVPIIWIRRSGLEKLGADLNEPALLSAEGETELVRVRDTGYNVVGYIAGSSDTTVIIGAHYDHLGWGGPQSRFRGEKKIHPGADDNASGTAALLEVARFFADKQGALANSLEFIAFSGEEKGILGSSYYAKHMTIDSGKVKMMINMDMIGRLKNQENGLAIMGTGTCPEFKRYFDSTLHSDLKLAIRESGTGPSDHTAFYNRGIPVLFFFTGAHNDYHKPDDTIDKIDFGGIVSVAGLVTDITTYFDTLPGPLTFQKTKGDGEGRERAQFSVTLGVMPDYTAEVKGLKIDGVSPGRPAERAGIQTGDIVIKIGDFAVDDIYTYMNCLSKFKKGDSTVVVVRRGDKTMSFDVVFN